MLILIRAIPLKESIDQTLFFRTPLFDFPRGEGLQGLPVTPSDASDETGINLRRCCGGNA